MCHVAHDDWRCGVYQSGHHAIKNLPGNTTRAGAGVSIKDNNIGTSMGVVCHYQHPPPFSLSLPLGPDSHREIQFLLSAPCCPDRIYHLEPELKPDRHTFWTAPVTTRTILVDIKTDVGMLRNKDAHSVHHRSFIKKKKNVKALIMQNGLILGLFYNLI